MSRIVVAGTGLVNKKNMVKNKLGEERHIPEN